MPGSFVHLELNTDDIDRAKEFYQQLFGWNYLEWPMGDSIYWGVKTPEPPGGGIQTKPMPHAPTQWVPYISVEDINDTVARARSAGAEIIVDFMKVGDAGEMAIVRDPTGATIGLWKEVARTNGQSGAASASGAAKKKSSKKAGAEKAGAKKAASKPAAAKKGAAKKGAAKKGGAKKAASAAAPAPTPGKSSGKKAGKKSGKKKG
jgi:predicted enzyme related to lactoylglutathione lyase